jgi:hypothetical protein
MWTKRPTVPLATREAEWKQLLLAVEPSVERGVNLGIHTFKQVLEEYQKALDEWFHHKKDKLQQLLAPDRNRQWNDRFSESLKYR